MRRFARCGGVPRVRRGPSVAHGVLMGVVFGVIAKRGVLQHEVRDSMPD